MTEPVKDLHPKEIEPEVKKLLNQFSDLISETVNYGTHILNWDVQKATGSDENIPITLMLRHILELTDSISILVKESSIDPCKPLLRAALESLLQLEYILEEKTVERSLSFLVWNYHKQIKFSKKLIPGDLSNSELKRKMQMDKLMASNPNTPIIQGLENHIANMERAIQQPLYQAAENEYQRLRTNGSKVKNWYELYSNLKSFEQLANHLNRQALYEILYRGWSGPTHGTDILQGKLSKSQDGMGEIVQMRFVKDAQTVTYYAMLLNIMTFQMMTEKRIPDYAQNRAQWYLTIRDAFLKLSSEQLIDLK